MCLYIVLHDPEYSTVTRLMAHAYNPLSLHGFVNLNFANCAITKVKLR